jgi:hypothetical protein
MQTVSWDTEGCIQVDFIHKKGNYQCSSLHWHAPENAMCSSWQAPDEKISLQRDNACHHTVYPTLEKTGNFGWAVWTWSLQTTTWALWNQQGSAVNCGYMVAKFRNRLLLQQHIVFRAALAELSGLVREFCEIVTDISRNSGAVCFCTCTVTLTKNRWTYDFPYDIL